MSESAATTCPRCGAETTEAQLTYSGCPMCQAEAAENARQDAADEARSAASACCTDGCEEPGTHLRAFYVRGVDPSVYGEIETVAAFCCDHVDMLDSDVTPLVDLRVSATVRS